MKFFHITILVFNIMMITIMFYLINDLRAVRIDPNSDGQAGIGVAMVTLILMAIHLAAWVVLFIYSITLAIKKNFTRAIAISNLVLLLAIIFIGIQYIR